ncbi:hypothetical protein JMK10_20150 [Rhodovulum sulfidophilum]|uniref:hypothetical protein n=1 Tax=Rhodovulum sulfidophilum TaxID=35806 RepID=UPI001922D314|nr:hypothetical protein [Rhodovulum sulfidophilum]MBL3576184.1 hypothetical protein [Rhodovulum sulfidophilum]MCE8433465.1 hypothetical protein [Rhodovulum sulfidophilum]MCF4119012.1 hypothetical protein [Rhodovulum sulfidophilum]
MTETAKFWTREDVARLLNDIDYEAAKEKKRVLNYYRDENNEYATLEVAVFIVLEWVQDDVKENVKSSTVRGTERMGWLWDAFNARKRREEYGDLGDHCLISEGEARETLREMGLDLEEGKRYLVDSFTKVNGYAPVMLPVDPRWENHRDAERKRLGLPSKE